MSSTKRLETFRSWQAPAPGDQTAQARGCAIHRTPHWLRIDKQ